MMVRRTFQAHGTKSPGSLWRSLIVVASLTAGATLANLPGYSTVVSAEPLGSAYSVPGLIDTSTPEPSQIPVATPSDPPAAQSTPIETVDPSPVPTATPWPDPTPSDGPTATPTSPSSPAVEPSPSDGPEGPDSVALTLTTDRVPDASGVIRVEPTGVLALTVSASASRPFAALTLRLTVPAGWQVLNADGGVAVAAGGAALEWRIQQLDADRDFVRTATVRAPDLATASDSAPVTFSVAVQQDMADPPVVAYGPALQVLVAPAVTIAHVTLGRVPGAAQEAQYILPDEPLTDSPRFEIFRVRFDVANSGSADYGWTPTLQWAPAASDAFQTVAAGTPVQGQPFFGATEWIAASGGGTELGPTLIWSPGTPPVVRATGVNPIPALTIPAGSRYMIEFSVEATVDASYSATYQLRLTDAGSVIDGASVAYVQMSLRPNVTLTPGQRDGLPGNVPLDPRGALRPLLPGSSTTGFHAPSYDLSSATCANCHRAHTAEGPSLIDASTQVALCASCHDGTSAPDVMSAYAGVPPNDSTTRAYYQHDPTSVDPAYGLRTECSSCHNPHDSTEQSAVSGAGGWSAPGAISGASAVSADYSSGTLAYTLIARPSLEYQLCLKCHSGYATLPSNAEQPLSRYALDKGVELDPGNASYHPISAPGKNATTAMAASLAGTSPFKLWNFSVSDTVRCANCHADARLAAQAQSSGTSLAADAPLGLHASPERGLLIAAYRDRVLKGPLDAYQAADFALCFVCHSEAPFLDASGEQRTDTNFRYHGLHVSGSALLNHGADGTNIDQPGDGGGLAVCAECHFRIHSSAYPVYGQSPGPRLVDFAPDVSGGLTPAEWTVRSDSNPGTCALKCHGQPHSTTY